MAEEFDVFADSMNKQANRKPAPQQPAQPQPQQRQQKKQFHKNFQHRPQKQNNSPLRGANGEESVNPLFSIFEKHVRSSSEKPLDPLFAFAFFRSISSCATLRSPHKITGF